MERDIGLWGFGISDDGNVWFCPAKINQGPWLLHLFSLKGITCPFPHSVSFLWIIPYMSSSDHIKPTCRCLTEALGVQQCCLCVHPWWWRSSQQWCPPEPQPGPGHTLRSLWSLWGGLELHTLGKNKSEYRSNACGREQHLGSNIGYLVKRIFFHQLNKRKTGWCIKGITDYKWGKLSNGRPGTGTGAAVMKQLGDLWPQRARHMHHRRKP